MRKTITCAGLLLLLGALPAFAQSPEENPEAPPTALEEGEEPAVAPEEESPAPTPTPRPAEEATPAPKAAPAPETLWSSLGGNILPSGDDAVRAWIGFPGIGAAFVTPLTRRFQLGPYFQFNYGTALGVAAPFLGVDVGAELKYQFYDKDKLSFAFVADPGFRFHFDSAFADDFGFGMRFGPRVEGSYGATANLNVLFEAGLPFEMLFHPTFVFHLPISFGAGVAFSVYKDVNLYFTTEIGPLITASEAFNDVDIWYRGQMGAEYRF